MCGIFTASDFNKYMKLYNKNKERGTFAYGALFLNYKYDAAVKTQGTITLSKNMIINNVDIQMKPSDFYYFMGHTQAPTSAQRDYDKATSHPFQCGDWIVAHNGVLTNDVKLKARIKNKNNYNTVDTSVIPALLDQYS